MDTGAPIKPLKDDVKAVLHIGYSLKNGLPYTADFVRLSAFDETGRGYAGYVDVVDIATSRRQRDLDATTMLPLIPNTVPGVLAEPEEQLVKPRRKRGEPKTAPGAPETGQEKKTS